MPVSASENIPAPGFQGGTNPVHQWGVQIGDQYSAPLDYELLAGTGRFQQVGITVQAFSLAGALGTPFYGYASPTDGRIMLGTVMGRVTATKKYVPYKSGAGDGSQVPLGILRHTVDTTNGDTLGNLVTSGILRGTLISGAATGDANIYGSGYQTLNARLDQINDEFIF
jgi:hypothetical protein